MITGVEAILLISSDAKALAEFYRDKLGLPIEEEQHEGIPLHYACDFGGFILRFTQPVDGLALRFLTHRAQ